MPRILRRSDLIAAGMSGRAITAGTLIRVRRDHYARPGTDEATVIATRVGGPLACVSALRDAGLFAMEPPAPHIHLPANHSRARSPRSRWARLTAQNRDGIVLHWHPLLAPRALGHRVSTVDALRQALRCQPAPMAIASVDNALFTGAIRGYELDAVFAGLPASLRDLRARVDGRCESGQESVLRLLLEEAGLAFELQVDLAGVGRVDFVVEGRLVIEADSRLAHSTWAQHRRDRDRDLALARVGIASIRPHYAAIMFDPEAVIAAVRGLLARRR